MPTISDLSPARRDALELRFNGPIPQSAIDESYSEQMAERFGASRANAMAWADRQRQELRNVRYLRAISGAEANRALHLREARIAGMYKRGYLAEAGLSTLTAAAE